MPRKGPDVHAGMAVGRKLEATGRPPHDDSGRPRPRYVALCEVRTGHVREVFAVALWQGSDHLAGFPVREAQRRSTRDAVPTIDIVMVAANPWRALGVGDIADIWRVMPPGSVIRPIHRGRAAVLLVERPDGGFSQVGASPVLADIPGAMRLAYGDDAPPGTWAVKKPFHLR